jgi:hypothetical protein
VNEAKRKKCDSARENYLFLICLDFRLGLGRGQLCLDILAQHAHFLQKVLATAQLAIVNVRKRGAIFLDGACLDTTNNRNEHERFKTE